MLRSYLLYTLTVLKLHHNLNKIASTALAACFVFCTAALAAPPTRFDAQAFNALGEEDRYNFVLAALRSRESQLQNFSYKLTCTLSIVEDQGVTGAPFRVEAVELRRLGPKTFIHVNPTHKGQPREQTWSSWDGTTRRSRHLGTDGRHTGRIADTELGLVNDVNYNDVLGFRVLTPVKGVGYVGKSRSEWMYDYRSVHKRVIEVSAVDDSGNVSIHVKLLPGNDNSYQLWFDPERDFMLVKERYDSKNAGDDRGFRFSDVTGATQADGLWVPTKVTQVRNHSVKDGGGTRYQYDVSSFVRNKVQDADLIVDFVPGADVVDSRNETVYRVAADGKLQLAPTFDPSTGLTKRPDQTVDDVFAAAQNPFKSSHRTRNAILAAVVSAILLAVFAYAVRRRLHRG
jgi:hypothetical protein